MPKKRRAALFDRVYAETKYSHFAHNHVCLENVLFDKVCMPRMYGHFHQIYTPGMHAVKAYIHTHLIGYAC